MADDETLQQQAERLQAEIDRLAAELTVATTPITNANVSHVGIKISPFWKRDPVLWYNQIEAQFSLARITIDDTKFFHVVSKIDTDILQCCADIIRDPPTDGTKYESIKCRIIAEYAPSASVRMQMLLQFTELGGRKPSQLLRELQSLAVGVVSDEALIKRLWLQCLPELTQAVLNVLDKRTPLKELAEQADKLADVSRGTAANIMSVTAPPAVPSVSSELQELKQQIATLTLEINAFRRAPKPQRRSPAREPSSQTEICYYHRRFGSAARQCRSPCKFQQKN